MKKIFCFLNGANALGVQVCAITEEDGELIASHCCSSEYYAKHDIGIESDWKHEKYKDKYPEGYELIWIDVKEKELPSEFLTAVEKGNKISDEME